MREHKAHAARRKPAVAPWNQENVTEPARRKSENQVNAESAAGSNIKEQQKSQKQRLGPRALLCLIFPARIKMQRAGDDEHREAYYVHTLSLYRSAVVLHIDLRDFFLAVDIVLVHSPRVAAA